MGYLLRLTEANFHLSPSWILNNLGCKVDLKNKGWKKIMNSRQFHKGFYKHVGKTHRELACLEINKGGGEDIEIFGHQISYDYIQSTNYRFCPECLSKANYHRKIWDLVFVTACPFHKKLLADTCPHCGNRIHWNRNRVSLCPCGFDLKHTETEAINSDELMHNLILFEVFKIDTPYNLDLIIKRNPLRNIPIEAYIEFLIPVMNFLSHKENNGTLTKTSNNKFWHLYSLKAVSYFENYPQNITSLFEEAGTEFENYQLYNQFINAIKGCSENKHLFFILIAFSEFENQTFNYPKFESLRNLKNSYVNVNEISENLEIDREILSVLLNKGLVVSFKEFSGFLEGQRYITRKKLNEVREKIKSNVSIHSALELLRLEYKQILQLINAGLLKPTEDSYFSNVKEMRFNLHDIEKLIKEFGIPVNQPLFEVKNGAVHRNEFKNELAALLDSIDAVNVQNKEMGNEQLQYSNLLPLALSKSELEEYLINKRKYFTGVEKERLKKAAKFLRAKLEDENKVSTNSFDYEKCPFSIGIDDPNILSLKFKQIVDNYAKRIF